jgi:redox-regulated HSP33 family molecular chaperone
MFFILGFLYNIDDMEQTLSEKRWAENEVVFRQANERVIKNISSVKDIAEEDGQQEFVEGMDEIPLLFYCECSNENCRERISITPKEYVKQHRSRSQFILISGHHIAQIERILKDYGKYIIVEKFMTPPEDVTQLHKTSN